MNTNNSVDQSNAIARAVAMDSRCKIAYLIPHVPQSLENSSIFGWYTEGLHDAANAILAVANLPADIREPHTDIKTVLIHRLTGTIWPFVNPIETTSLAQALEILPMPFRVCISTSEGVAEIVDALVANSALPILHVSTISGNGRTSMANTDVVVISNYVRKVLDALTKDAEWAPFVRSIRQYLNQSRRRTSKNHPLNVGLHNIVLPNERALEAFGRKFQKVKRISIPISEIKDPQHYISRICASADAVFKEREVLLKNVTPDIDDYRYVLAVPSIYWGQYKNWQFRAKMAPEAIRKDFKQALKNLIHATTYFDRVELSKVNGKHRLSPIFAAISEERSKDMRSYTATLAAIASNTLTPVIRLEPKLNGIRVKVNELARCVRAAASHHFAKKTSRMIKQIEIEMRNLIDPSFLDRLDRSESSNRVEGLKLITDVPLEFLKSNGMPLALRFDCSRISPIPGNLSHQIATQPPLHLPMRAFNEVLIIRSFSAGDPLRKVLFNAIQSVTKGGNLNRIKIKFVDVNSASEVIDALKSYSGCVVVFDCHGTYSKTSGMGALVIGSTPLSFWDMRHQCQLPPIVMFSACDTQPIDGSHSSVATSAFVLGARAVLGTLFPISAFHAAVFNARMILRMEEYIAIAIELRKHVTWREVVSGMLRMSYSIEVMMLLVKHGGIRLDREVISSIQLEVNNYVSIRHPGWYKFFVDRIASEAGCSSGEVQILIDKWCGLTDAMKYVHLGNPERIIIHDDAGDGIETVEMDSLQS